MLLHKHLSPTLACWNHGSTFNNGFQYTQNRCFFFGSGSDNNDNNDDAKGKGDKDKKTEDKDGDKEEEKNDGPLDEDGNPIPRAKPLFFKESDYHLRVPHEKY